MGGYSGATGPLVPGQPVRLTYNLGADAYPSWLPDGSHMLYQAEDPNTFDRDRCLFEISAAGGTDRDVACDEGLGSSDTTSAFGPAAASPDGRLAYFAAANPVGAGAPTTSGIYLGALPDPTSPHLLLPLPFVTPSGARPDKLTALRWLGDSGFLALADRVSVQSRCQFCPADTLETGIEVLWVAVHGDSGRVVTVPGTSHASSYSFVAPDTIYFTVNGAPDILRTRISGSPVDVVFTFQPESTAAPPGSRVAFPAIARGVQVHDGIAFAVAGGRADYLPDSGQGERQRDWGGDLHQVDLATGADSLVHYDLHLHSDASFTYLWIRNPALSPDGRRLTAEGRVAALTNVWIREIFIRTDTLVGNGNLWQFALP